MIRQVLLAEDERGTALLVKRRLEQAGFEVSVASNGREALEILRARPMDLLVTDVVMPEMDGVDLYLAIKNDPSLADLPVIIITDKKMFQESFTALGVDHFVSKASDCDVLIQKIRDIALMRKEGHQYHKVLICGGTADVTDEMRRLLREKDCLSTVVEEPAEIVGKALVMVPHVVLVDLMMGGRIEAPEVVRALRSFGCLKDTRVLMYMAINPEEFRQMQNALELLEGRIRECREAGADQYLGRFNRLTFMDGLKEFGIV